MMKAGGTGSGRAFGLAVEAASVWIRHNLIQPFRSQPGLPRAMHYISTHRCNARCVMCGIWKETDSREHELSADALSEIVADRLFSQMEFVGISGGEPFLRDDLPELCGVFLDRCAKVKRISVTTNGTLTRRMSSALPEIAERTRGAGALLDVSVSLHGMGEMLDEIYGVERAFAKIERTIAALEELRNDGQLSFSLNCVLLASNLAGARGLKRWAAGRGIPLSFVIGEHRLRFRTEGLDDAFVAPDDLEPLVDFLKSLTEDRSQSAASVGKYREIAAMLEGRKNRSLSCYYAMGGVLLGHDGRLFYCSHSKEIGCCRDASPREIYYDPSNLAYRESDLLQAECLHCPPYTRTRWEIEKDLPQTLVEIVRQKFAGSRRGPSSW
jgi:MoaA/NifB/PqqE/SkfB family radical SAM enzyme